MTSSLPRTHRPRLCVQSNIVDCRITRTDNYNGKKVDKNNHLFYLHNRQKYALARDVHQTKEIIIIIINNANDFYLEYIYVCR